MRVHYISRKNGKGVWCYAEKGVKQRLHHSKGTSVAFKKHIRSRCLANQLRVNNRDDITDEASVEMNQSPVLVFIHGFGGDKDAWPSMVKHIPNDYHCIVVDLPGHGDSTFVEGIDEPSVEGYANSLREFLEVTGLDESKIYLIGCSYGGAVAALFTFKYPECVRNLALLCPAIKTPIMTEACQRVMSGNYDLLIPETGEQFLNMIEQLSHKTQYFPKRIMQSYVNINFHPERQSLLKKSKIKYCYFLIF
jgi:pimeloyl-ACP methyl ester carboxylesterase